MPAADPVDEKQSTISVKDLTCRFGDVRALDGLSLDVERAHVTGIVGPNGAGKTTLVDVVCGLIVPTSGKATVFGQAVKDVRARIGVVPQETALYEELSATENLEFSAALYHVAQPKKRIDAVLDLVGLSARKNDRVGTFSGGMQRRLAIARALLHDPELLVLDEPTLGVDVEARHQIWNHIRRLRDEGRTILLTTNYLDEAEALCDVVAVVRDGKLVAKDTPAALVARAGRCVELECSGDVERVTNAMSAYPRAKRVHTDGDRVTVYIDASVDPDDVVRAAMEATRLKGFRARSPDLMEILREISVG